MKSRIEDTERAGQLSLFTTSGSLGSRFELSAVARNHSSLHALRPLSNVLFHGNAFRTRNKSKSFIVKLLENKHGRKF